MGSMPSLLQVTTKLVDAGWQDRIKGNPLIPSDPGTLEMGIQAGKSPFFETLWYKLIIGTSGLTRGKEQAMAVMDLQLGLYWFSLVV